MQLETDEELAADDDVLVVLTEVDDVTTTVEVDRVVGLELVDDGVLPVVVPPVDPISDFSAMVHFLLSAAYNFRTYLLAQKRW